MPNLTPPEDLRPTPPHQLAQQRELAELLGERLVPHLAFLEHAPVDARTQETAQRVIDTFIAQMKANTGIDCRCRVTPNEAGDGYDLTFYNFTTPEAPPAPLPTARWGGAPGQA